MLNTNKVWLDKVDELDNNGQFVSKPRGMKVKENVGDSYTVDMPAFLSLPERRVNYNFMFGEAFWILSGSNRVSVITKYMDRYRDFSDDNVFMSGAYGPKIVDQLPYITKTLKKDKDSRQALLSIWRERPDTSKDIPCTISMQFFIRNNKLYLVVNMRSNDIVYGFTYDVFTFSMVAFAVKLLISDVYPDLELGTLTVQVGSLHLYEKHFGLVKNFSEDVDENRAIFSHVDYIMGSSSYEELLERLKEKADTYES